MLALMAVLTFIDVIGREAFKAPIPPKVELTELLMGLCVYLGLGLTTITRGHIRVDIVIMYLPVRSSASRSNKTGLKPYRCNHHARVGPATPVPLIAIRIHASTIWLRPFQL